MIKKATIGLATFLAVLMLLPACDKLKQTDIPTILPQATEAATVTPGSEPTIIPSALTDSMVTQVSPKDGMVMVNVSAGEFLMGATDGLGEVDETPLHIVNLDAFWIDQTEVTNTMFASFISATSYLTDAERAGQSYVILDSQFEATMGADWNHPQGPLSTLDTLENHPVVQVSWNDAFAYCQWVERRLPTEAEWEKAARGVDGQDYPWGPALLMGAPANYADMNSNVDWAEKYSNDGFGFTAPVGSYPLGISPYGALDMAGNAYEWVADWYGNDYYNQEVLDNPLGPASGQERVMRGGSWSDGLSGLRAAGRDKLTITDSSTIGGFRCASSD